MNTTERFSITAHPASEIFPLMQGADFDALVADIKEHGQREPIILHDGQILDGRNRHRACVQIGLDPTFLEWHGEGTPEAFVISMNLHRRHLDASQRAMIAARLANIRHGEVGNGRERVDVQIRISTAADMLNTGRSTVAEAKKVLQSGTQEEIRAVERGEAAVSTTARAIRNRKKEGEPDSKPNGTRSNGDRVKLPNGDTMESVARRGRRREAERLIDEIVARMKPDLETAVKQAIIDDYCEGRITESEAMQQIKALGLKHA